VTWYYKHILMINVIPTKVCYSKNYSFNIKLSWGGFLFDLFVFDVILVAS